MINQRLRRLLFATGVFLGAGACHAGAPDSPVAAIPYKRDAAASTGELPRLAVGMAVFALAAAGAIHVIRRRLRTGRDTGAPRQLHVRETQRLNPRALLHVVEFAGAYYLVAQSEQGIQCLASSPTSGPGHEEQT